LLPGKLAGKHKFISVTVQLDVSGVFYCVKFKYCWEKYVMWWLITLLVLALIGFFIVKSMKSGSQNDKLAHDNQQQEELDLSAAGKSASDGQSAQQAAVNGVSQDTSKSASTSPGAAESSGANPPDSSVTSNAVAASDTQQVSSESVKESGKSGGAAIVAATAAAAGVAAYSAGSDDASGPAGSDHATGSSGSASAANAGSGSTASINTGNNLSDVREMIKILNLDGPDAARLDISREELDALRKGAASGTPDASSLENVASKLRLMMA